MNKKEKIAQAIFQAIDDVNQLLKDEKIEKSLHTNLLGESAKLDSLGLLNFIVAVEDRIDDCFGVTITLASESAISHDDNAFKNVQSLVDYIDSLLKD